MRSRTPALAALVLAWLVLTAATAQARVPNRTPTRRLGSQVSRSLGSPAARGTVPGIYVERGGAPMLAVNPDRPLTPASLTKIATTLAAILKFGPEHRFATRVYAERLTGGVVGGDLILVGGGDPAFATEAFGKRRFLPDHDDPAPVPAFAHGYATVEELAEAVRASGVRRVAGDLIVDETLFDDERTQQGWKSSYQKPRSVEVGNLSALTVNEGLGDIDGNSVAPDPAINAGRALRAALAKHGVVVAGAVRHGRNPKGAQEVAHVLSPPVSDIVAYTNRWSVNYPPEMLLKGLGARFGGAGTTAAGVKVVAEALGNAKIPLDNFAITDGSGLSILNRMTPRTVAALVRYALDDSTPAGKAMRESMPVAGGPGTLLKRLTTKPAAGNLRGKTGWLQGVRAMAGWVTAADGSVVVYVTIFNDAAAPGPLAGPIDLIGLALARFPYL